MIAVRPERVAELLDAAGVSELLRGRPEPLVYPEVFWEHDAVGLWEESAAAGGPT